MDISGQFHSQTALPRTKQPSAPIVDEAGWTPGPVWTLALLRIEARFFSRLACRLIAIQTTDRVTTQAISRRLPVAAARVRSHVRSCGIFCEQSGTGADFLRILLFFLTILIPPTAPHSSSSIIWGWYSRRTKGRRTKWTQSHLTPRNENNYID
jgi:hypothetical protein